MKTKGGVMVKSDAIRTAMELVDSMDPEKPFELILMRSDSGLACRIPEKIRAKMTLSPALCNIMAGAYRIPVDGLQEYLTLKEIKSFVKAVLETQSWFQVKTAETDIYCMEPPI
ncbi:MAG: hypothetical protein V1875_09705 [Candidatus Altiarchaeota archaeon]